MKFSLIAWASSIKKLNWQVIYFSTKSMGKYKMDTYEKNQHLSFELQWCSIAVLIILGRDREIKMISIYYLQDQAC